MSQADAPTSAADEVPVGQSNGERRLVEGLRRGDGTAADELVERYGPRAYGLAMAITRNAEDAEDVVEDALGSVVRNVDTFRSDVAVASGLYRIITNAACGKVRRTARQRAEILLDEMLPPATVVDDWSGRFDDPATLGRVRAALNAALDDLSPEYRAVVALRDVEGLTLSEAAASLGISVEDARRRLHRARLFLRQRLALVMAR